MEDPVRAADRQIRELVNSPHRKWQLLRSTQQWFRLCASMDAIGDTHLAIRAYLDKPIDDARSDGWSYLVVYGVLQVLYVQQDAVMTLARCLKLSFELPPELQAIRDIRNDAIGHPTGRGTMISRITLSPRGFQLLVNGKGGRTEFRNISVRDAAEQQTTMMGELLGKAVEQLVSDEVEHRRMFRGRPLRDTVPETLAYFVEKVAEGLWKASGMPMARIGIDTLRSAVQEFREAIEERGLTVAYKDTVGETLADVAYALERIESRLDGRLPEWTARDADIYWYFLGEKVRKLQTYAAEIDKDYESDEV